jgi:hypothetical protein
MENVNLENKSNNANTLLYADIKLGMMVKDELGRKGRVIANDDIDNIKISFGKGHAEYYSLKTDNKDGVSKLYICV